VLVKCELQKEPFFAFKRQTASWARTLVFFFRFSYWFYTAKMVGVEHFQFPIYREVSDQTMPDRQRLEATVYRVLTDTTVG
jgi:hypothetical protein